MVETPKNLDSNELSKIDSANKIDQLAENLKLEKNILTSVYIYDSVCAFSDGLVRVMKDGNYGYIDRNGNEVIACKYDHVGDFRDGLARVDKDGKWGYIDKNGNEVIACKYDHVGDFRDGLAEVRKDEKYGRIDKKGNEVIACEHNQRINVIQLDGYILVDAGSDKILYNEKGEIIAKK